MTKVCITKGRSKGTINKNIYGHFSEHLGRCIYDGIFVGENSPIKNVKGMRTDVVEAMRRIHLPVLRWPGGCFADEYHWQDGIGKKEERPRMVNTHWGGVVEDNSFGTHEFLELCEQVGCEPYINANLGSGTVQEMAQWVEYLNSEGDSTVVKQRWANGRKDPFNVKYWGVGNENWGCGGNMRPEYYADEYRRYQTYCRNYGKNKLFRIACGSSGSDYEWTEVLMKIAGKYMDGLTLHHYTVPKTWADKGYATECDEELYYVTLEKAAIMDPMIRKHAQIMDKYDPEHRVSLIVDEWGCWFNVEKGTNPGFLFQQNTMRDAMVAALTLNIFNRHCDRVSMANIAQTVNVLQAIILTEGDQMVLTPTYHVFDLYQPHMDATETDCYVECGNLPNGMPQVSASASEKDGAITVTLANLSATEEADITLALNGFAPKQVAGRILQGDITAHNTFDNKDAVVIHDFKGASITKEGVALKMPPLSIIALTLC